MGANGGAAGYCPRVRCAYSYAAVYRHSRQAGTSRYRRRIMNEKAYSAFRSPQIGRMGLAMLTQRSRYAMRAMLFLAEMPAGGPPVPMTRIAIETNVPR